MATGRVLAHVQPTGIFQTLAQSALQGVTSTLTQGFNPLGILTVIQNQQIKNRLAEVQSSLSLLQNMQVANLAVSGLGLGVSVVGFAVMLKELKSIKNQIDALSDRVDQVTRDRRDDTIAVIFADISAELETVDSLSSRNDPRRVAEDAQRGLARASHHLQGHFERVVALDSALTEKDLDLLWSLAAAMRLCSDAGIKALFRINELSTAAEISRQHAHRFAEMGESLSADKIARLIAGKASKVEEMSTMRQKALIPAKLLVGNVRTSARLLYDQSNLAKLLVDRGASGRQYLEEAEAENEVPLLYLPA